MKFRKQEKAGKVLQQKPSIRNQETRSADLTCSNLTGPSRKSLHFSGPRLLCLCMKGVKTPLDLRLKHSKSESPNCVQILAIYVAFLFP